MNETQDKKRKLDNLPVLLVEFSVRSVTLHMHAHTPLVSIQSDSFPTCIRTYGLTGWSASL